jgi:hypothetical protein
MSLFHIVTRGAPSENGRHAIGKIRAEKITRLLLESQPMLL